MAPWQRLLGIVDVAFGEVRASDLRRAHAVCLLVLSPFDVHDYVIRPNVVSPKRSMSGVIPRNRAGEITPQTTMLPAHQSRVLSQKAPGGTRPPAERTAMTQSAP